MSITYRNSFGLAALGAVLGWLLYYEIASGIGMTVAAYIAVLFMGAGLSGTLIGVVLYIAVLVVGFCTAVRRFHDFNWGGASVLLLLIPLVNIVIIFVLLFRSGTRGTNDYGNEPDGLAIGHGHPQVNPMWPD